jgi:hypothetical protein
MILTDINAVTVGNGIFISFIRPFDPIYDGLKIYVATNDNQPLTHSYILSPKLIDFLFDTGTPNTTYYFWLQIVDVYGMNVGMPYQVSANYPAIETPIFNQYKAGLVPASQSTGGMFLRDDGTWQIISGGSGGSSTWGGITGTLSNQTDLQATLISKADITHGHSNVTSSVNGFMSATDKTKLDTISAGATVNASDSTLLNRTNHIGTQLSSTISDLTTTVTSLITSQAQPIDGDLTSIANLAGTSGLARKTALNTWILDATNYLSSITSGNVITALGYTPYNATNPAGYISSNQSITLSGDASGTGTTSISISIPTFTGTAKGLVPVSTNTANKYLRDDGTWQIISGGGASSWGSLTGTLSNQTDLQVALNSKQDVIGYTPYNATNPANYISSITSGNVITALGYTPYNVTNPAGYISSIALSKTVPATPATTILIPYNGEGTSLINRPGYVDEFGIKSLTMFDMIEYSQCLWTTHLVAGVTTTGTVANVATGNSNKFTRKRRSTFKNVVTTTNQTLGLASASPVVLGSLPFYYRCIFSTDIQPAGSRLFLGMSTAVIVTSDAPAVTVQGVGFFQRTTDPTTTLNLYTCDGATQTITPLTVPAIASGNTYELELLQTTPLGAVTYQLKDYITDSVILSGNVATTLPLASANLNAQAHASNGTANIAVGSNSIAINAFYCRSLV